MHSGTQRLAPVDTELQSQQSALEKVLTVERQQAAQAVSVAIGCTMMDQHAFLQRQEWIDGLDIGGTARHMLGNLVQLIRTQLQQRSGTIRARYRRQNSRCQARDGGLPGQL